jgi:hypothetical protein
MSMKDWPEVTDETPCPICSHHRRCKIAPDGNAVRCFRHGESVVGWATGKLHTSGATYHRIREHSQPTPKPRATKRPSPAAKLKPLPADRLHTAYTALIERLTLQGLHYANLVRRGMEPEEFERRQYRSMPTPGFRDKLAAELAKLLGDDFQRVPGFGYREKMPALFGSAGMLIPIRDVAGRIVAIKIRSDGPNAKFRYTYLSSKRYGGLSSGAPAHVPLGMIGHTETLRICEGELKADIAFLKAGLATISFPGADLWREAIAPARDLGAKTIRVAFDSDARTNAKVAAPLLDCVHELPSEGFNVELELWSSNAKGIDDALLAGERIEVLAGEAALNAAIDIARAAGVDVGAQPPLRPNQAKPMASAAGSNEKPPSQAEVLLMLSEAAELWHTPDGEAYATVQVDDHKENYLVRSRGFRLWLERQYYIATAGAPNSEARQSALAVIEAKAKFDGEEIPVHLRTAAHGDAIYIDLANRDWQVVEVTANGWSIVNDPPVRFRRAKAMWPLPLPVAGGSLKELRKFINVSDDHYPLVLAWLVFALRPIGPYPVLCLYGEAGSGKSTQARFLRELIDPNAAPLRCEPKEPRDLMIAANNGWVTAFDNLSFVPTWLSDCICRLSTGGGFSTRTLYENDEETIFDSTRPVILTGIEEVATRGDLIDRSLLVSLPVIPENERKAEAEIKAAFGEAKPRIFGALLDAVAGAMRNLPTVRLDKLPRMADFALWSAAAEQMLGLPVGEFMRCYAGNREGANETAIESSPVSKYVIDLVASELSWTGTATELLAVLNERAGFDRSDGKPTRKSPKHWPVSPRALSGELRRLAPNLRQIGIEVSSGRTGKSRFVTLARMPEASCVTTVTDGARPENPTLSVDAVNDGTDDAVCRGGANQSATSDADQISDGKPNICVTDNASTFSEENGKVDPCDGSDAISSARSARPGRKVVRV